MKDTRGSEEVVVVAAWYLCMESDWVPPTTPLATEASAVTRLAPWQVCVTECICVCRLCTLTHSIHVCVCEVFVAMTVHVSHYASAKTNKKKTKTGCN